MKIGKWTTAMAMALLLSSGSVALAQGQGKGKGRATKSTAMTTKMSSFIKIAIVKHYEAGMASIRASFLPGSRRRIVCRPAWKSNLSGAGHCRQDCRNDYSLVRKSSSGGCLLPLPTALMY